jgi:hypothetical protein
MSKANITSAVRRRSKPAPQVGGCFISVCASVVFFCVLCLLRIDKDSRRELGAASYTPPPRFAVYDERVKKTRAAGGKRRHIRLREIILIPLIRTMPYYIMEL